MPDLHLHGPGPIGNASVSSRRTQPTSTAPWEERESAGINPIKLKAMAMRLRHRVQGYRFKRTGQSELASPLLQTTAEPETIPELPRLGSVANIIGPNNVLGLETIFYHPICVLLIAVPLGIISDILHWPSSCTFWLNFLALVPLAKVLGDATEELAASLQNDTVSGLLNATFGNAVELIVSIQSIRAHLFSVVKASLLGSVLSNILLVLGMAFLFGGLTRSETRRGRFHSFSEVEEDFVPFGSRWEKEQKFPVKGALLSIAMLLFSCMSFALPTIFNSWPTDDRPSVLKVSRIGACIVSVSYMMYLVFQLLTHNATLKKEETALGSGFSENGDDDEEEGGAGLTAPCALFLMAISTLVVALNSELLVGVLEAVVESNGIPESFIGVILLPIAGNACEHASAIRFAMQDRPGLAIGISVGSATQIALFVVPFSVIIAWFLDEPLDLDFGDLNTAVVTLSILVVLTLLLDGRSNWFKGYILCSMYGFLSVLYWFVPNAVPDL